MSTAPILSNPETVGAGESTMFDSLARLVPDELQAAYYRVLAHTRMLSPDDEMLRILEAMGVLALLTRHTPKDIAEERERFQELLSFHQQSSDQAQQKMLSYVHALESRLTNLPAEVESGLNPEHIAKLLGESLRQHFLGSGLPDTVKALQATSTMMTNAQKELSIALRTLSDSHSGVVAQVESANRTIEHSVESRARTLDTLLREWKSDLVPHLDPYDRRRCTARGHVRRHGDSGVPGFGRSADGCGDNVISICTGSGEAEATEH